MSSRQQWRKDEAVGQDRDDIQSDGRKKNRKSTDAATPDRTLNTTDNRCGTHTLSFSFSFALCFTPFPFSSLTLPSPPLTLHHLHHHTIVVPSKRHYNNSNATQYRAATTATGNSCGHSQAAAYTAAEAAVGKNVSVEWCGLIGRVDVSVVVSVVRWCAVEWRWIVVSCDLMLLELLNLLQEAVCVRPDRRRKRTERTVSRPVVH